MSDRQDEATGYARAPNEAESASAAHRCVRAASPPGGDAAIDWYRLAGRLARLGPALWLHRDVGDAAFPRARLAQRGVLLLDHPALTALSSCVALHARAAIGSHGPREWLELIDARGTCSARLCLLPDTDYLAWDAMLAECAIARARVPVPVPEPWRAHAAFMRCALRRKGIAWHAQVVRFPLLQLPCLRVLGLRAPVELSVLGGQVAATIARDENVTLRG